MTSQGDLFINTVCQNENCSLTATNLKISTASFVIPMLHSPAQTPDGIWWATKIRLMRTGSNAKCKIYTHLMHTVTCYSNFLETNKMKQLDIKKF